MGASIGVLLLGGAAMAYQAWYKSHVLSKMEKAFEPGEWFDRRIALFCAHQLARIRPRLEHGKDESEGRPCPS